MFLPYLVWQLSKESLLQRTYLMYDFNLQRVDTGKPTGCTNVKGCSLYSYVAGIL